ncbi:MAG: hypothetical protein RIQ96_920, partial [Pseudomonadota bacterium]
MYPVMAGQIPAMVPNTGLCSQAMCLDNRDG